MIKNKNSNNLIMTRVLIYTIVFLFSQLGISQSKISGVITYYFNNNLGDKPDLGATVYLVPFDSVNEKDITLINDMIKLNALNSKLYLFTESTKMETLNYEHYKKQKLKLESKNKVNSDSYFYAKEYVENYEFKKEMRGKTLNEVDKFQNIYDLKTSDGDAYSAYISTIVKAVDKTVVDGAGNYGLEAANGEYYVIIKSKNRKGSDILNLQGRNYIEKINLNKNLNVSHNFGLYE
jgi:hypothetical protein